MPLGTAAICVLDGEEVELEEIDVIEGDVTEIAYASKEKHNNIQIYVVK